MDESKVKEWVEANCKTLMTEFGIPHWRVDVEYGECQIEGAVMECSSDPLYEHATIRINAQKVPEDRLQECFEHELLHVVDSQWDSFWPMVYDGLGGAGTTTSDALREAHRQIKERSCKMLERLVYGLRNSPANRGRGHADSVAITEEVQIG